MRRLALVLSASVVVAGCATFEEPVPPAYTGPTAEVKDSAVTPSNSLAYIFELQAIDGKRLRSSSIATRTANAGRGMSQTAVVVDRKIPAVPSKVSLGASTQYAAPILAMLGSTCSVEGTVDFNPEPGKTYVVRGQVAPEACSAWIEDAQTQRRVTAEVTGPGTK